DSRGQRRAIDEPLCATTPPADYPHEEKLSREGKSGAVGARGPPEGSASAVQGRHGADDRGGQVGPHADLGTWPPVDDGRAAGGIGAPSSGRRRTRSPEGDAAGDLSKASNRPAAYEGESVGAAAQIPARIRSGGLVLAG